MRNLRNTFVFCLLLAAFFQVPVSGQTYGKPDRAAPGDARVQAFLAGEANKLHGRFMAGVKSLDDWQKLRAQYKEEYLHMLGLWPLPPKTPLKATTTRVLQDERTKGFVVEMVHYQSRPGLYVTGNLYRPEKIKKGARLPGIFYVCGHSYQGRDGNKTAYQSHGIWFARHGYVCLVVDSLQLGEIGATHHGTYREERWWWHSRGYTPAGVECWNGIRGIDYLVSRPDVDPGRIGVTGISGGGAATFWIAAADERVCAAAPVSGMADLPSYINNRVINGHCDCMFLYNTFQWPWTRIAALIAPRPFLFVNSDADPIFPMDANDRIINRLERIYSLYGAGDRVDSLVSIGGHAYRQDIRQGVYRFMNTYLKQDPRPVTDSEVDLVTRSGGKKTYPIAPEALRVFPADSDIPKDELNTTIDEHFVPVAKVAAPKADEFVEWKKRMVDALRRISFQALPLDRLSSKDAKPWVSAERRGKALWLETEADSFVVLKGKPALSSRANRVMLVVLYREQDALLSEWLEHIRKGGDAVFFCHVRGAGPTRWTRKNPPNYVERSQLLVGRTVDTGRVWDVIMAALYLKQETGLQVCVAGEGGAGVLAAAAALLCDAIDGVAVSAPPSSFMNDDAPRLLNVLRVCDISDILRMLGPRLTK